MADETKDFAPPRCEETVAMHAGHTVRCLLDEAHDGDHNGAVIGAAQGRLADVEVLWT